MKNIIRFLFCAGLSVYLLALSYIPLLSFDGHFSVEIALWIGVAIAVMAFFIYMLNEYKKLRLLGFLLSILTLHGLLFLPKFQEGLDVDRCLDSGGVWVNNVCEK